MIDLRSDTVTNPTSAMRKAMAEAEVGDDVFGEDPTVRRLQEVAAQMLGQEAALFVPSGTMGNQIAIQIHTCPGQQVIAESRCHIFNWELGGISAYAGCQPKPVFGQGGHLKWIDIEEVLNPPVYYRSRTGLIALENTHNMAGGTVLTEEEIVEITTQAGRRHIPVHLDGARIFHAGIALGCSVASLARHFDSVMFCLSKGLCAPVGSILAGSHAFIKEARTVRKRMGGGMRQVGVLAAAGLVALEEMPARLSEDHVKATKLAQALSEGTRFSVDPHQVQTNIVMATVRKGDGPGVVNLLQEQGILAVCTGPREIRFVTHHDVTLDDIETAVRIFRSMLS